MIKLSLNFLRATHGGVVIAQRAVRTYTRYAFYSFRDRKGQQSVDKSRSVDGPRHSLLYNNVEDFLLSQVGSTFYSLALGLLNKYFINLYNFAIFLTSP